LAEISICSPRRIRDENVVLLRILIGRNYGFYGLADYLVGSVTEQLFGASIPSPDDAVEVLAGDRVVRRLDNCGKSRKLLGAFALGDIDQHVHCTRHLAGRVTQRCWIGEERHAHTVRPFCHRLHALDLPPLFQGDRHRTFVVQQRRSVRPVHAPRTAPIIRTQFRLTAP